MSDIIRTAEDIEAADKLELRAPDPESGEPRRFDSMVQDVTEEGIVVSMPTEGRVSVPLPEGTPVVVSVWKGFADHRFKSRVLSRLSGRIPCLVLARPGPDAITRRPRREHYRVTTRIPAAVRITDPEAKEGSEGIVADLSARGCRLQTTVPIPREACVSLDFDLPFPPDQEGHDRTKPLRRVKGQVRWNLDPGLAARSGKRPYVQGIECLDLDNVSRSALLRYVALRQRELIRQMTLGGPSPGPVAPSLSPQAALREAKEGLKLTETTIREIGGTRRKKSTMPPSGRLTRRGSRRPRQRNQSRREDPRRRTRTSRRRRLRSKRGRHPS